MGTFMGIDPDKFAKIAESLRQYRRAELSDFQNDIGGNPVDLLYVEPLESDAVLKTVLLNNTTFLVGRKGTGKSTVFAKAQIELRKRTDAISVYVDVKSLHELLATNEAPIQSVRDASISEPVYRAHFIRKGFLGAVISDLIKELKRVYESRSLIQRWIGSARGYNEVSEGSRRVIGSPRKPAGSLRFRVSIPYILQFCKNRRETTHRASQSPSARMPQACGNAIHLQVDGGSKQQIRPNNNPHRQEIRGN